MVVECIKYITLCSGIYIYIYLLYTYEHNRCIEVCVCVCVCNIKYVTEDDGQDAKKFMLKDWRYEQRVKNNNNNNNNNKKSNGIIVWEGQGNFQEIVSIIIMLELPLRLSHKSIRQKEIKRKKKGNFTFLNYSLLYVKAHNQIITINIRLAKRRKVS